MPFPPRPASGPKATPSKFPKGDLGRPRHTAKTAKRHSRKPHSLSMRGKR